MRKKFLLHIFNDILSEVIPILKPGKDLSKSDSYRPISMLPCARKLFKKKDLTLGVL
jgi:hypothetical protein